MHHLSVELELHEYWAIRKFNFDMKNMGSKRRLKLNELEELHNETCESAKIYKAQTKAYHDKFISKRTFEPNQKVWLFNLRLRLFSSKLRSHWNRPFILTQIFPHKAIKLKDPK